MKRCVPVAKDFAEEVTDFAKCVPVINSASEVVVMCASKAETGMQMKRMKVECPPTYAWLEDLRGSIAKRMIPVLYPDRQVDNQFMKNVFNMQQELVYMYHCRQITHISHRMWLNPLEVINISLSLKVVKLTNRENSWVLDAGTRTRNL